MIGRRAALALFPGIAATLVLGRGARAGATPLVVARDHAMGAVASATIGGLGTVAIDRGLGEGRCRIAGGEPVLITGRILLKGTGAARGRFLDDPRNAPKLGANLRDLLVIADPTRRADYEGNHRRWSRELAREILRWNTRLAAIRGRPVKDLHGRIYLLEWAGARVGGGDELPALKNAPVEPAQPALDAYRRYVEALVDALLTRSPRAPAGGAS